MPASISVIIPCFNAAAFVREAIASVQAQTHAPVDIICVDDGSTDETLHVLREIAHDEPRMRVLTGPNRGAAAARNRGAAAAQGTYVQFLDADDYLHPQKLEHQRALVRGASSPPDIVFGAFDLIPYPDGGPTEFREVRGVDSDPWCGLIRGIGADHGCGHTCSNLWRKGGLQDVGGMRDELRIGEDNRLVFDLLAAGAHVIVDDACLTTIRMRVHSLRNSDGQQSAASQVTYRVAVWEHLHATDAVTEPRRRLLAAELIRYLGAFHRHDPAQAQEHFAQVFPSRPLREAYAARGTLYTMALAIVGFRGAESVRWRQERLRARWQHVFGKREGSRPARPGPRP